MPLPRLHPGIRIDKISPQGEEMGVIFTIGALAMFLIALPLARALIVLSLPTGIIVGLILYLIHRRPARRERIISLHLRDAPGDPAVPPYHVTQPSTPPAPRIRVDKTLPVGEIGVVFTIVVMGMILISLPQVHDFFAWSFPLGLVVGLILYLIHRRPPRRENITSLHLRDLPARK
jgi:hypothetical protein